jgi:site-specific recombinase XerD
MKPTDFAIALQKFFHDYLAHQRGCSTNTIKSYRDTFKIFLYYMLRKKSIPAHKITLNQLTSKEIKEFQKYLMTTRKNSERTRIQRMAAIHSFINFLQHEYPDRIAQWQQILAIPQVRCPHKLIKYLTQKETAALMSVILTNSKKGWRDKAMILLLYDSGARVQELVDLTVRDIRLDTLAQVTLTGKGKKMRVVPLMPTTVQILNKYGELFKLLQNNMKESPLFKNRKGEKLTRFGVSYLLKKYGTKAKMLEKSIPSNLTPHILRHSKAIHLLEQGVSEIVIQNILGHTDMKTTAIYAKINSEMIRNALKKINNDTLELEEQYSWQKDEDIMSMLESL